MFVDHDMHFHCRRIQLYLSVMQRFFTLISLLLFTFSEAALMHIADWYATFAEIVGASVGSYFERQIEAFSLKDGVILIGAVLVHTLC